MSEGKDLFQGMLEAVVNHYSKEAVIGALDFIAELSEEDLKSWTSGMSPEQTQRVYRVAYAARGEAQSGQLVTLQPPFEKSR